MKKVTKIIDLVLDFPILAGFIVGTIVSLLYLSFAFIYVFLGV